jgi:predicted RNA methylase
MTLIETPAKAKKVKLGNTSVTGKEQYYTPHDQAIAIIERASRHLPDTANRVFLEPAGGTGAFIEASKEFGFNKIVSFDIEPKHPDVQLGDFLAQQLDLANAVCITNPPFGRNNSLSVPFFNKAAQYSDLVAFIVPRSWRKWTVLNRLDQDFELVDDWDLALDYVNEAGHATHGVGNLRTCVQVWRRSSNGPRGIVTVPDHGIIEKTTPEKADVSFTLFGYGCGTVKLDFPRVKNTTQAFYKLVHPRALEALQSVDFSRFYNHTAYTEALGFSEINFLLNEYLELETSTYSNDPSSENYLGLNQAKKSGLGDESRIF